MGAILEYMALHGRQPRKHCAKCKRRLALERFSPHPRTADRHDARCKECCAAYRRTGVWPKSRVALKQAKRPHALQPCAGKGCERMVRRGRLCSWCLEDQRAEAMANAVVAPSPKVCGLPKRGGTCGEILLFQVNRVGDTVLWCPTHGERLMPVLRPGQPGYPDHVAA